jgi:hypothetical protein
MTPTFHQITDLLGIILLVSGTIPFLSRKTRGIGLFLMAVAQLIWVVGDYYSDGHPPWLSAIGAVVCLVWGAHRFMDAVTDRGPKPSVSSLLTPPTPPTT